MVPIKPATFVGTLAAALAAPVLAETAQPTDVQGELAALRARIAQLESKEQQGWLNERRAEEVKGLVREVLADADTRATLLQEGALAGISDKGKIFLKSADGSFGMNIGGQLQFRYIFNFQDEDTRGNSDDAGFQIRRAKLAFDGHIADPKLTYEIVLATEREDGNVFVEDFIIGYKFDNGIFINAGTMKIPFLREELLSSKRQLAVERASVTEFFTLDRSEQVQVGYGQDKWKAVVSINDGADEEFSTIGDDPVEFAIAARGDLLIIGDDMKVMQDITAAPDQEMALGVGGAIFYQMGKGANDGVGSSPATADYFSYTVDAQFEMAGLGLMGAFTGGHIYDDSDAVDDRDMFGILLQGGYRVTKELEPYVRWEYIDSDDDAADEDTAQLVTVGLNWYLKGHNAKLTTDLVWVYDGDVSSNPFGNSAFGDGLGFSGFSDANEDDYILIRSQFQLLF